MREVYMLMVHRSPTIQSNDKWRKEGRGEHTNWRIMHNRDSERDRKWTKNNAENQDCKSMESKEKEKEYLSIMLGWIGDIEVLVLGYWTDYSGSLDSNSPYHWYNNKVQILHHISHSRSSFDRYRESYIVINIEVLLLFIIAQNEQYFILFCFVKRKASGIERFSHWGGCVEHGSLL